MENLVEKFYIQAPQKYYQPLDYSNPKAQAMLENEGEAYMATQKNDGEWCRLIVDGENNVTLQSRTISKVTGAYGDKTELVPHIVAEAAKNLPANTVLLGELCFDDIHCTSKDVGTILRCLPAKAIARQKDRKLYLIVFDCLMMNGNDISNLGYEYRYQAAAKLLYDQSFTYLRPTTYTMFDFPDFLADILERGGEGIVIQRRDAAYEPGKRTAWQSMKVKKILKEFELQVTDFIEPKEDYEGKLPLFWNYWIGMYEDDPGGDPIYLPHPPTKEDREPTLVWKPVTKPCYYGWKNGIIVDNHGTLVRVTSGMTDEDKAWCATEEAYHAMKNGELYAVVTAMEETSDHSLRHPRLVRLRTDVNNDIE